MSQATDSGAAAPHRAHSLLGLVVGLFISVVLSAALVFAAAKAGITPGVSPLVVLFGWVLFGSRLGGGRLKPFLAIAQVTGSAGAAVTAGVVFTAPIVQIVYREQGLEVPPVDVVTLILASISGSLMGFGFVGLATKRFLSDPKLPAPEAVASDRLIATAVSNPDQRPKLSVSLLPGLLFGLLMGAWINLKWLVHDVTHLGLPTPWATPADGAGADAPADPGIQLPIPVTPLYIGIGALLTLPTAALVFAGGLINATSVKYAADHAMPDTTFRWVGGAAMLVAVVYSLVAYIVEGRKRSRELSGVTEATGDEALLEQTTGVQRMLKASIAAGAVLLFGMAAYVGAPTGALVVMGLVALVLVSLLSGLGGLLSLQVGSSASPVSGTVFVAMLVLSLTALKLSMQGLDGIVFLVPLVVAACVAICAANDSSQDYKTMQLNGFTVSDGFKGQLVGLLGGAVAVPLTLMVAHNASVEAGTGGLGGSDLACAQASFFGTVLGSLFLDADVPWGPIQVGLALGVAAVGLEILGKAKGLILSSLAFAVGIYLPAYIGIGMMLGATARFLGTRNVAKTTHEGILVAAGLITGDAFASLILGFLIFFGFDIGQWEVGNASVADWVPTAAFGSSTTWGLFLAVLVVIFVNYLPKRRAAA